MALTATIVITPIPNMASSAAFQVSGTYQLSETTWTDELVYEDNGGNNIPIASPAVQLGVSSWSFTHPALSAGTHTVSVKDPYTGATTVSNSFTVGVAQKITANPISGAVAGTPFTFTGTLTNFSTAPVLSYSLNGASPITMSGVTSSGWSTPITIASAGSYTILVSSGSLTSNVVSFTVSSVTVNHVITPNPPTPVSSQSINYVFYDTFTSLADVTDQGGPPLNVTTITSSPAGQSFVDSTGGTWTIVGGVALLNGTAPVFSANVIQLSLVNGTVWSENSSQQWYSYSASPPTWTAGNNPLSGGTAGSWANHYPFGGSEYTLSANGELEYFASSSRTPGFTPFSLIGGAGPGLVITCDSVAHTVSNPLSLPYNSGCISSSSETSGVPTTGLFSFTYGLIEIYALLPGGSGYWPGFVLYPQGGGPGELDIMESGGGNTTEVFGSIHYTPTGGTPTGQSVGVAVTDYTQNWHNYAVNWTATTITWYVDGNQYASIATPANFIGQPYFIAIDLAIQGNVNLGFDGIPNASTPFPNTMQLQWVRVSQGTTTSNAIGSGSLLNFTGSLTGYTAAPSLTYQINNGALIAMTGVTATGWAMQFNAPTIAGTYNLTVSDGTTSGSTTFVVGAATKTITPLAPNGPVAGTSFTFTGVMAGYLTIPALTYSINGGAKVPMTGVSITGWAMTVTIASAGAVTMVVSDGAGVSGSVTFTVTPANTGTLRNFYQNPGMDGSFWVQPFANSANWITSGPMITALRGGTPSVNLAGNYSTPYYIGQATDPLVTVTDGTHSIVVHIPLGAVVETPLSPFDQSIGGTDATQPYLVWSISGATLTVNGSPASAVAASGTVITGTYGFAVCDGAGLFMVDAVTGQPGDGNAFGLIQEYELSQISANPNYVIQHMLTYQLDPSFQPSSSGPVWPLLIIDTSSPNQGPLPQGLTVGIPANVARPTGKSRGFYALWDQAQQYGLFFYNVGSGGGINISIYDNGTYASLVADMVASWPSVASNLCILNYASGVSGAQYSLATTKGAIPGSVPAFTPPPPLNLAPTGGLNVAPSTFGAWYPSGYNAIPTNSTTTATYTISPIAPANAVVSIAFTFVGTLTGYSTAPTLTYSLDSGPATALGGVTATGWSTPLTISTSGTHVLTVTDAAHSVSGSVSFAVATGGTPTVTPVTWNPADLAGGITLSNNNYTATATGSTTAGGARQGVRATSPINTGKIVLWEMTAAALNQDYAGGVANATFNLTGGGGLGADNNGIGCYPSTGAGSQPAQTVYYGNAQLSAGNGVASAVPAVITFVTNGLSIWFSDAAMRSTSGVSWNNGTTANPITNVGGFPFVSIGATYYPVFSTLEGGASATLNDGTSALSSFAAGFIAANPSVVTLSGSAPQAPGKTIAPATPSGVIVGTPFTFTGVLTGYTTAPNLTYSTNGGGATALPGVTASGWSTTLTISATGTDTITVTDGTVIGTTGSFTVSTSGTSGTRVTAPLTGTVTTGTWVTGLQTAAINTAPFAGSGQAGMQWSYLLPAQYNPNLLYPILVIGHPDFGGMNGSVYLSAASYVTGQEFAPGLSCDTVFNTVQFRTAFPCIVVAPQCWQPGADTIDNFGGYGDTQNSAGNEQGVNMIAQAIIAGNVSGIAASSVDPGRRYLWGYSLGAIGALAWLVDNNQWNGPSGLNLWTAGVGCSDQLNRPNGPSNSTLFARMASVPYFAVWTTTDNNPSSYDIPAWQSYTGGSTTYPTENNYTAGGMAAVRAGTSQFYAVNFDADSSAGDPATRFMQLNSLGGNGTTMWTWLFGQIFGGSASPTITGVSFAPQASIIANSVVNTIAGQLTVGSANGALTGVTYALSSTTNFKVTTTGQVQFNSASVAAGSYALTVTIGATNASNSPQSYGFSITVTSSGVSGVFSISGGKVIGPNGQPWIGRGVAMHDSDVPTWVGNAQGGLLTTFFPGVNMVRIAAFSYWSPSTYAQQINWLTALNIVVLIDDTTNSTGQNSGGAAGVVYTVANGLLTPELNWYTALAQTFTNTYVWFGTDNEPSYTPSLSALYTWQQQTYQAIRATGNQNIIEFETPNPFLQGALGGVGNQIFAQNHNVVFGPHFYSWIWNGNGSTVVPQSTIYSSTVGGTNSQYGGIVQQIANLQTFQSLDGVIPCGCFETGPATSGLTQDVSGINCVNAVFQAVTAGNLFCFIAWAINTGAGDLLNNGTSSLTSNWGALVATQTQLNTAPTPPPQAVAAGYSRLVFQSDFTSTNEVAPNGSATANYNWFWQTTAGTTAANISVNPTATAASISNGNSGGGSFASPAGGIVTLNGPLDPGGGNVTICSTPEATQGVSNPGFGCWSHVYIEIYAQCQPNTNFSAQNQWFALWFDGQILVNNKFTELDLFETFAQNFSYPTNQWAFSGHDWTSGSSNPDQSGGGVVTSTAADANWHLYGLLWVKTGNGTGYVEGYRDNVLQSVNGVTRFLSGTGGTPGFQYLELGQPIYVKIGGPSGAGGNLNIDYVRVWST